MEERVNFFLLIGKPEDETPTKMGSKTIPDIMIITPSHYRAMTTRSLGIHDLVGI